MAISNSVYSLKPFIVIKQTTQDVVVTDTVGVGTGIVKKVYQGCDTVQLDTYVVYKYEGAISINNNSEQFYIVNEENIYLIYTP